jgi:hypothetical protein
VTVCWENYRKEQEDSTLIVCPGPAENGKVYPVVPEYHTFPFKKKALTQFVLPAEGDRSSGIDDAVPRNIGSRYHVVECVSGKPWLSLQPGKNSNHAVCAHATSWYLSSGVPDPNIGGRTSRVSLPLPGHVAESSLRASDCAGVADHRVVGLASLTCGAFFAAWLAVCRSRVRTVDERGFFASGCCTVGEPSFFAEVSTLIVTVLRESRWR